jgi:hypothetical protein
MAHELIGRAVEIRVIREGRVISLNATPVELQG